MSIFRLPSFILLTTLFACAPTDKIPLSGNIIVEYSGTTQSGDAVMFTLANGTKQPIYFRGTPEPAPGMVKMSCYFTKGTEIYVQGSVEPALKEKQIEVKPGERLHLHLGSSSLPPEFKSHEGRCQLHLTLQGGAVVESREFVP